MPLCNWQRADDGAIAIVRFGTFREPVAFDHDAIVEREQPMIVIPEDGVVSLPRGFTWDWQVSVDLLGERLTHYEHY